MSIKISAFIITKNEEKNIESCLRSLNFINEIVVVDDFSDDATQDICKKYGVKLIEHKFTGFRDQKKFAMEQTTNDWVLELDADERVSEEMKMSILSLKENVLKEFDGFEFRRKNYFLGKWLKHSAMYPDYKIRLYNKQKGRWSDNNIHEKFILNGKIKKIDADILHYQDVDLLKFFLKTLRYNKLVAEEMLLRGKKAKWYHYTIRPFYTFLYRYIFRLGFLDGFAGFIISVMGAFGTFAKYSFLKEFEKNFFRKEE